MINPLLYGLTNSFLRKQLLLVLRGFLGLTTAIENFEVMKQYVDKIHKNIQVFNPSTIFYFFNNNMCIDSKL